MQNKEKIILNDASDIIKNKSFKENPVIIPIRIITKPSYAH